MQAFKMEGLGTIQVIENITEGNIQINFIAFNRLVTVDGNSP